MHKASTSLPENTRFTINGVLTVHYCISSEKRTLGRDFYFVKKKKKKQVQNRRSNLPGAPQLLSDKARIQIHACDKPETVPCPRRPVTALLSCGCAGQLSVAVFRPHHLSRLAGTRLHSRGYILNPRVALAELPLVLRSPPRFLEVGAGAGPRPTWPGARLGGARVAPPPARRPALPPAGPGGRSQVFAGARMSELWLRSGSGSLRSLRAGLPAHPEPRGAPAALPAARPPGSQPPGFEGRGARATPRSGATPTQPSC